MFSWTNKAELIFLASQLKEGQIYLQLNRDILHPEVSLTQKAHTSRQDFWCQLIRQWVMWGQGNNVVSVPLSHSTSLGCAYTNMPMTR